MTKGDFFFKSNLVGLHVENNSIMKYARILNCTSMNITFVYLGIPIGVDTRKICT